MILIFYLSLLLLLFQCCITTAQYHTHKELGSGWDDDAELIFGNQMKYAAELSRKDKRSILDVAVYPLGNVTYFVGGLATEPNSFIADFVRGINGIGGWEPTTFKVFLKYLPSCTHYIDFGTWLGPTLFFATQLVPYALGIEGNTNINTNTNFNNNTYNNKADPVAYAYVSYNLALNRNKIWSQHTFVQGAAVGLGSDANGPPTEMNMTATEPGNSCSGVGKTIFNCGGKDKSKWFKWKVNAYSLPSIMHAYNIPTRRTTFIKVDIESFECALLPSWKKWFVESGNQKPTLYVSFHSQILICNDDEFTTIAEIAKLYIHVSCEKDDKTTPCFSTDGKWILDTGSATFSDLHSHLDR